MGENSGGPEPPDDFNIYNILHRGEMPSLTEPKKKSYKSLKHSFSYFTHPSDTEKYFVLSGDVIRGMDIFQIQKGLELVSKEDFKRSMRLPSGDILLQTKDIQQLEAIKATTVFGVDKKPISVSENGVLNQSHAIIRCRDIMKLDVDYIRENLADQKVVKVQRLKRREKDSWIETSTHILTFDSPLIPAEIKVGFLTVKTEVYIPAPFRCVLCQRLGHTKKRCNSKQNIHLCGFCAEDSHLYGPCLPPKCVNCPKGSNNHPSSSKNCPRYLEEKEVNAIRVTMRIPYNLDKEEMKKRKGAATSSGNFITADSTRRPSERTTYSQALQTPRPTKTCTNSVMQGKNKVVNPSLNTPRVAKITNKAFKRALSDETLNYQSSQTNFHEGKSKISVTNHSDTIAKNLTLSPTFKQSKQVQNSNYSQQNSNSIANTFPMTHISDGNASNILHSPSPTSQPPFPSIPLPPSPEPPDPDPPDSQLSDDMIVDEDMDMSKSSFVNFRF